MDSQIDDALVYGYEHRIASITLRDTEDRHIPAAAVQCDAQIIVTANLRIFPAAALASFQIVAEHSDDFLARLFSNNPNEGRLGFLELCQAHKSPSVIAASRGRTDEKTRFVGDG